MQTPLNINQDYGFQHDYVLYINTKFQVGLNQQKALKIYVIVIIMVASNMITYNMLVQINLHVD